MCQLLFLFIQYADNAKYVAEGKYIDKNTHLKRTRITHRNETAKCCVIAVVYAAYSQCAVGSLHVSVFSLHEDTHDHADVCTAHGTAVERSHSVRTALAKASVSAWY